MTSSDGRILVLGGLNLDFVFRAQRLPVAGETIAGDAFQTTRGGKAGNRHAIGRRTHVVEAQRVTEGNAFGQWAGPWRRYACW